MSYTTLKPDAPSRGVTDVGPGDFVKIGSTWKPIAENPNFGRSHPAERSGNWTVTTTDGRSHGGWGINRYAKAEDLESR